ncbi:hypothetical protein Tco_0488392 [Tanacetum coccineum]
MQGIFDAASYDEEGVVIDFNNLPTEVAISPIPTLRIHNIYLQSQILGDPKSSVQTRSRVKQTSGAHALEEPKKISKALKDDSWVEALSKELFTVNSYSSLDCKSSKRQMEFLFLKTRYVGKTCGKSLTLQVMKNAITLWRPKMALTKDEEAAQTESCWKLNAQPSSSTVPPPPTSQPAPPATTTIPPTPITEPTSEPSSPPTCNLKMKPWNTNLSNHHLNIKNLHLDKHMIFYKPSSYS